MNTEGTITTIVVICLIAMFLVYIPIILRNYNRKKEEEEFIENHREIRPGMSKYEVLSILGDQYTQSFLKNGVEKLEWRFRSRSYSGTITRRISVKFKDGEVIEVNSLNMD